MSLLYLDYPINDRCPYSFNITLVVTIVYWLNYVADRFVVK